MEEKEYLQTLGEQILNPHARTHVLEEICLLYTSPSARD